MCLDQGIPLSDAVMNTPLILLSFRLSVTRVLQGLQSETMSFWNRQFYDYFLSVWSILNLNMTELQSMRCYVADFSFAAAATRIFAGLPRRQRSRDGNFCRYVRIPLRLISLISG